MEQSWLIPCKEMSCVWGTSLGNAMMHRVLQKKSLCCSCTWETS